MTLWPKFRFILGVHRRIKKNKKTKRGAIAVEYSLSDSSEPVVLHRRKKNKKTKRGAVAVEDRLSDLSEPVVLHRRKNIKKNSGKSDLTVEDIPEDIPEVPRDSLSNLPGAIIHKILSFVDMKDVVSMSVLSTRWRYVWSSLPFLNFDMVAWDQVMRKKNRGVTEVDLRFLCLKKFLDFVGNVIKLRNDCDIMKFDLSCELYSHNISSQLKTWIMAVLRKNVQEFNLRIDFSRPLLELPSSLLSSPSLQNIKLQGPSSLSSLMILPDSMCSAGHLKTLKLVSVKFPNGDLNGELCLNFPTLEDLTIVDCGIEHLKIFNVLTFKLKYLYLEFDATHCVIAICTPSLTTFKYHGCMYKHDVHDLPALVSADIDLVPPYALDINDLLGKFCEVKSLTLSARLFQVYDFKERLVFFPIFPMLFGNLKYLKVTECSTSRLSILGVLLNSAPHLETFVLQIQRIQTHSREVCLRDWQVLSSDCLINLKSAAIMCPEACDELIRFLIVLLKNAKVLEKLTITMPQNPPTPEEVIKFFERQLRLQASKDVKLRIV